MIFWKIQPETSGNTNQKLMTMHHFALGLVAVGALAFSGCATDTTPTTNQARTDSSKRVHTQEELLKSGETDPGSALEKTDPAVRMSGPR